MLAIISDLHFQDVESESFIYKNLEGELKKIFLDKNPTLDSLEGFCGSIKDSLSRLKKCDELVIVFNGDIFEITGSFYWLETGKKPYHFGLPSLEMEKDVLRILERIENNNLEFFNRWREILKSKSFLPDRFKEIEVKIEYLFGNHDRLAAYFPSTRKKIRELLNVNQFQTIEEEFKERLLFPRSSYNCLVLHGHQWDKINLDKEGIFYSPIGDFITLEIASYLGYRFREMYCAKMMQNNKEGSFYRLLYKSLLGFDNVRPSYKVVDFLGFTLKNLEEKRTSMKSVQDTTFEILKPILLEIVEHFELSDFVKQKLNSKLLNKVGHRSSLYLLRQTLKVVPSRFFPTLINLVSKVREKVEFESPAKKAYQEEAIQTNQVDLVVAGHTHVQDQVALGRKEIYLDTGTWRTLIKNGDQNNFSHLNSLTYLFLFSPEEKNETFEMWTGSEQKRG